MSSYVVTASGLQRSQADLAQSTTILADKELDQRRASTIGETLDGLPGLSSTYFGPGASRPIIRGLGGDRIRILENGVGTIDASVASPDHAVSVEPFLVERVEVVRGPASLMHGSSAVGGVVNVISHRIGHEMPDNPVSGLVDAQYGSAADERSLGGLLDISPSAGGKSGFVVHLDGFRRRSDDVAVPGFAKDAATRAGETAAAIAAGDPAPAFAKGHIPNTAVESSGGAGGITYVGSGGFGGFAASGFDTTYGVPNEEDVKIDLHQRRVDLQAELTQPFGVFSGARIKFGHADYRHVELEGGMPGTTFTNRGYDGRIEVLHEDLGGLAGAWGVQAGRSDFAALGEEAFLPPSVTKNEAVFAFEEAKAGPFTPQAGVRYERQTIDVADGSGRSLDNGTVSFSAGTLWNPVPGWVFAVSVTRTNRAPTAQELLANGPHVGTGAYEVGDASLGRERSTGVELVVRRPTGFITGELSLFANRFAGYISEVPTGRVAIDGPDGFVLVDPAAVPPGVEALDEYDYRQGRARFHGAEAEAIVHLHDENAWHLHWRLMGDFVRATDGSGVPLPRIPAARLGTGLAWTRGPWSAGTEWQHTFDQDRVAANETASDGYDLVSANVAWHLERGRWTYDAFVRASNLTDAEARPHTSFLKEISPLPGRNVSVGLRLGF